MCKSAGLSSGTQCFKSSWWLSFWPGWLMAVICGREEWTLPILLTLAPHLSHSFPLSPFFPLGSDAAGNGLDDRRNEEEIQKKKTRRWTNFGEKLKGRRKWKDEECRIAERGEKKNECRRSSGSFIKTIIVQDFRIPPVAGVHVKAHIIN